MGDKRAPFRTPLLTGLVLMGLVFFLTGCGPGLPKELTEKAKGLSESIKNGHSLAEQQKEKYIDLTKSAEFKPVEQFALKENWMAKFDQAADTLNRAETLYEKEISPLLSKDKPELAPQLTQHLEQVQKIVKNAETLYRYPVSRFSKLIETMENAARLNEDAKSQVEQVAQIAGNVESGPVAKALADFPDASQKINARFAPLRQLEHDLSESARVVEQEYLRHAAGDAAADYAAFTDSSDALAKGLTQAGLLESEITSDMAQLYTSYTKILKDMKEEYFVTIKRESWDENSDYDDPRMVTFQRAVSAETYEVLTADTLDTIADLSLGFTGTRLSSHVDTDIWKELAINPTEQWPGRGHNAATFWVEDAKETYFHQYILEENGETRETDWEKVDESVYDANLEYLGMAILTKPYGMFEQERLVQAAPPGMAYVGNSKYGEWKEDGSGDRFWSWYGKYAFFSSLFFFPPSYYSYNAWNGWNSGYRNTRPYFGQTKDGFPQYGTSGSYVKQSPKFQSTEFARSGGFKSQTASVRGAGANLRGGGPNSKGK